jgi:hypothetical protein
MKNDFLLLFLVKLVEFIGNLQPVSVRLRKVFVSIGGFCFYILDGLMEIEVCGGASNFWESEFCIGQEVFSFQRELVFVKFFSHEPPQLNSHSALVEIQDSMHIYITHKG